MSDIKGTFNIIVLKWRVEKCLTRGFTATVRTARPCFFLFRAPIIRECSLFGLGKKKKVCKCIGIYVDEGRAESDACERFSSRTRASRARHAQGSRIGRENREDRSVR